LLEAIDDRVGRKGPPREREVGRRRAVERPEPEGALGAEPLGPATGTLHEAL